MVYDISATTLTITRGVPNVGTMVLDMAPIYEAEQRLDEVRTVNPLTALELMGYFNTACNITTKYLAWVEYEILQAKKYLELARAAVILEKAPEAFKRYKDAGMKYNEDFRESIVATDTEYNTRLDTLNALLAVKALLDGKAWSFVRAYNACKYVTLNRSTSAAAPQLNNTLGETVDTVPANFMGQTKIHNNFDDLK